MKIKTIHYFSGLILSIFIGLHLFNHFMGIFGVESHLKTMDNLRYVYRNFVVESFLLLAVFAQIVSGLKLFFSIRSSKNNFYKKLQIWTGLYLAVFLCIHVGVVLTGRYILDLDTNFYFGVAGLNTFPLTLFFIPYYGLAIFSFFGHLSAIHYQKMKKTIFGFTVEQQSKLIVFTGILFTVLIIYGLTNGFTGIEIPEEYQIIGK
ncbi:hypothetical protein [Kordia sp.]|uniref:hypothetical protein n=1 Tax=Kordia sp. TaxID=1965332 RepID=UPI003B59A160